MNAVFETYIRSIVPIEDDAMRGLIHSIHEYEYPARYMLIKDASVANHVYFIIKGAVRSFFLKSDKEVTSWFGFEGDVVTGFYSFIGRKQGYENIQLLEDTTLLGIAHADLMKLTQEFASVNQLYRRVLEETYLLVEQRLMNIQFGTAKEKYAHLLEQEPHVLQRVPLGYIASYLGVTQETLSRIRSSP
jgi:CRP-like cAMP-binding protein